MSEEIFPVQSCVLEVLNPNTNLIIIKIVKFDIHPIESPKLLHEILQATSVLDSFSTISLNAQVYVTITLDGGFGLHTEYGCYSQSKTQKNV